MMNLHRQRNVSSCFCCWGSSLFLRTHIKRYRQNIRQVAAVHKESLLLFSHCSAILQHCFSRAHNEKKAVEQSIFYTSRSYGMKHPGPDKCVVYHCDNKGGAERLQNAVELCFPHLSGKVPVLPMGTVTSCCCGPGAVAVSFAAEI